MRVWCAYGELIVAERITISGEAAYELLAAVSFAASSLFRGRSTAPGRR